MASVLQCATGTVGFIVSGNDPTFPMLLVAQDWESRSVKFETVVPVC